MCWSAILEPKICPAVVDIPTVIALEKTDFFPLPAGINYIVQLLPFNLVSRFTFIHSFIQK